MRRDGKAMLRHVEGLAAAIVTARRSQERTIIAARYPGRCVLCESAIAVGDAVAWRPNASAVHGSCFRGELRQREARP